VGPAESRLGRPRWCPVPEGYNLRHYVCLTSAHVVALLFPKLLTAHKLHSELPASIKFPVMELKISRFSWALWVQDGPICLRIILETDCCEHSNEYTPKAHTPEVWYRVVSLVVPKFRKNAAAFIFKVNYTILKAGGRRYFRNLSTYLPNYMLKPTSKLTVINLRIPLRNFVIS